MGARHGPLLGLGGILPGVTEATHGMKIFLEFIELFLGA